LGLTGYGIVWNHFCFLLAKNLKTLLVVSLPRSASTEVERICLQALKNLRFESKGEFLNHSFRRNYIDIKQHAKSEYYPLLMDRCLKYKDDKVLRDVVQSGFISHNIDKLAAEMNIIVVDRPLDEVIFCSRKHGWTAFDSLFKSYREELEIIMPVINAIKEFDEDKTITYQKYNWWNVNHSNRDNEQYMSPEKRYVKSGKCSQEAMDYFYDYCPSGGEDGIHTIESIEIIEVINEIKLL